MDRPDNAPSPKLPSAIAELVAEVVGRLLADPPAELLDAICARLGERAEEGQKELYTWPLESEDFTLWMVRVDPKISSTPIITTMALNAFVEGIIRMALRRFREKLSADTRAAADHSAESAD